MTEHEQRLCDLARVNIAWQGYLVGGSETGIWPFKQWRVWAKKDAAEYDAAARRLLAALHHLMRQLPEFGETP